jgi:hypothetical protein
VPSEASRRTDSTASNSAEIELSDTDSELLERLQTVNVFGDYLRYFEAVDAEVLDVPEEWLSWGDALEKEIPSLGVWAKVALATRCAERVSGILSYWPLRKHCADGAIRAAKECSISGTDFQSFDNKGTMSRIDELTDIGRAAFDAASEAKTERDGPAPCAAATAAGQAAFAARDAFRGATTDCALFTVQQAFYACQAVTELLEPLAKGEGKYRRLSRCMERVSAQTARADYEWLKDRVPQFSGVPSAFYERPLG